jgi:uncharacterized protein (TIGR00255 family)
MCYLIYMNNKNETILSEISSMTGFGSSNGIMNGVSWTWEVKSVNGKGLDVRCRLPQGYEKVDSLARLASGKAFKRGNLNLNLSIQEKLCQNQYKINLTLLNQLIETVEELQSNLRGFENPRLDGLFAVRGVIEPIAENEDNSAYPALEKEILASLDRALSSLFQCRIEEGARIAAVLFDQLEIIKNLCEQAEKTVALQPARIREKLNHQIEELLEAFPRLPDERLAQEAAIFMIKVDVREELDRLKAHVESAKVLMEGGGVIGRKLDFLCQEFNREVNTLCSKASDINLSKIGLELKAVIEQYREQVQNIE